MKLNSKKGFTLIELAVVILLITILGVAIFAAVSAATTSSKLSRNTANARSIQAAMNAYAAAHSGTYPSFIAGTTFSAMQAGALGPYLTNWTNGFCSNGGGAITVSATNSFTLRAMTETCTVGTYTTDIFTQ